MDSILDAAEPYFGSIRGPRKFLRGSIITAQSFFMPGQIDDGDGASVVSEERMVEKCDLLAIPRKAGIADPSSRRIENFSLGIFEPVLMALSIEADDEEVVCTGRPIGILHIIQQRARGAAAHGHSRQCSDAHGPRPNL